ncbi:hypothetical protein AVEN_186394-1 [Araneus ventricosus]|uniref:Mos1 transposase HTH domain-containing protein n=1 Tax=Araneus ventricosus TaxID=182803 RepID=A0A4Y2CYX1_ARAVE|nr:hypothetical protein AVEN_186394-1 [Araneus ventricosus]
MLQSTENPADCKIRSAIRFLYAEVVKAAEIHLQINKVYGEMVGKWARAFKDGRTNVHDGERSEQSSVITEDLVQKVVGNVLKKRRFTISSLPNEYLQVSRSVLYGIVTENLNYC